MNRNDYFNYIDASAEKSTAPKAKKTFAESVENLTSADIPHTEKKKKKRSAAERIIMDAIFVVCIGVFVVCLYKICNNLIDKYIGAQFYEKETADFFDFTSDAEKAGENQPAIKGSGIAALAVSKPTVHPADYETALASRGTETEVSGGGSGGQMAAVRAKLASMRLKNDEIFGVIKVTGTNIAYTVVRHDDNDYYLNHSTEKKPLVIGSIFLDCTDSTVLGDNCNSVMYGHNMTSGQMFHALEDFEGNISLFRSSEIYVYTAEGIYVYKPFSFYRTNSYSDYIRTSFAMPSDFVEWANNVKNRSSIKSNTEITADSKVLTLSTCINYSYNGQGRYALHAILVEVITD